MASLQPLNYISPSTLINNKSSHDASQNISIPSSSSYFGAPQINYHLNKQQTGSQPYTSAASIFKTMEENISKNVLNMIGIQSNKNNMMVATICNVIDTVVSNFVDIFDDRFKFALNQMEIKINKKNQNWMNNINDINNKINGILIKMDKNDKLNKSEDEEKEEKEQLVEILLNDINDIKVSLNDHYDNLEIKFIEISKKMEKSFNTSFEVHETDKNKMNEKLNDIINGYHNLEENIIKKERKMFENIDNKLKHNHLLEFKKLDEINLNILNQINGIKNWKNSLNEPSKVMINKLDEMNKEILNIKNKINNNMNKLENINKNMVNMKNECKTSTFSNDAALQTMGKKLDNNNNNNNNKIRKINVKYKNKKNNKKNNNKHKNKNKNKKINNKNNNNKEDLVLINDNTIKASLDNNNNNKDDIIWGQKSNPIITRNKTLYGEKNKEENGIEFFIECTTFDNQYGGCTKGNIVGINIKNNDNGEFKVYAIIKWHDELIKKYVIPERGKDATTTHLNWFVLDRKPEDDERDIHFLNLKGKSLDNNICLNKLYMGKNIIL